jgi:hypothetical protein
MSDALHGQHLVDEALLDADPSLVAPREITDELLEAGWHAERIG